MEKYSLKRMLRTAHLYEVAIYRAGADDMDYQASKRYKTYKGAAAYAMKMSREPSVRLVEVVDVDTDRDYYEEDLAASQVYINGTLDRDGLPMTIADRLNRGKAIVVRITK